MLSGPLPLTFDVTGQVTGLDDQVHIQAVLYPPAVSTPPSLLTVFVLYAGASFPHGYWDLQVPGEEMESYSFARYMAQRGILAIALEQIRRRVAAERLVQGLAGYKQYQMIGVGQGMGATLLTYEQGEYGTYHAVVLQGWGNGELQGWAALDEPEVFRRAQVQDGYLTIPRAPLVDALYWPDVPLHVRDADARNITDCPAQVCYTALHQAGVVAAQAAKIACPVLHVLGERDVSLDPAGELAFYRAALAHGVSLFVLEQAAHCHHVARSRFTLWEYMRHWVAGQAGRAVPVLRHSW